MGAVWGAMSSTSPMMVSLVISIIVISSVSTREKRKN